MTAITGFIGLGNMGGRMAGRLIDAGNQVVGFDLDPEAASRCGARFATSIHEAVSEADFVFLSLPDSRAVESVVLGDGNMLGSTRPGQIVVDLSTAAPASTLHLHSRLREAGVDFVDAGISGGPMAAEKGTLTLMVGGSEEALTRLDPTLRAFASKIIHMGGPGSGHATKLLNNFLNAINLSASSEVMVAAKKAGLDVGKVLEVINASSGSNWATQNRFPSIINGDYIEGGLSSHLMMKDVVLYLEYLLSIGAPTLNSAGPVASFGLAIQEGYGDVVSNHVVDAIGDLVGGVRVQPDI